jgi:hypothetical protein
MNTILYPMLIIFVEIKMASIDSIEISFLNLAKFREIYERHGFSIELAENIMKIHLIAMHLYDTIEKNRASASF